MSGLFGLRNASAGRAALEAFAAFAAFAACLLQPACAPHHEPVDSRPAARGATFDAGADGGGLVIVETDAGESGCREVVITDPSPSANHVPIGAPLTFATMPPVGGDHYPLWADFRAYERPIDLGYTVHSLEHGAVVLWYRCVSREACPGLAGQLEAFAATLPQDPLCASFPGLLRRIIVVPEPNLDTVVAASAWGHGAAWGCVDPAKLRAFVDAHYDRATESTCAPGIVPPPRP
jgi:hypothetical protein